MHISYFNSYFLVTSRRGYTNLYSHQWHMENAFPFSPQPHPNSVNYQFFKNIGLIDVYIWKISLLSFNYILLIIIGVKELLICWLGFIFLLWITYSCYLLILLLNCLCAFPKHLGLYSRGNLLIMFRNANLKLSTVFMIVLYHCHTALEFFCPSGKILIALQINYRSR